MARGADASLDKEPPPTRASTGVTRERRSVRLDDIPEPSAAHECLLVREPRIDRSMLSRTVVLENDVVFGSVTADRRRYEQAAASLAKADRSWLERLITRRLPLERWSDAIQRPDDDATTVLAL